MKFLHLSLIALLFATGNAVALTSDADQPIYIDSDTQHLDMKSNQVTFSGNVKLRQGSININASKVIVTRNKEDDSVKEIEAYGKPATFSQLTDEGKTLQGEAQELYYKVLTDQLTMILDAVLAQDESTIKGSKITYNISSQKLNAVSGEGERVKTVLQPSLTAKP